MHDRNPFSTCFTAPGRLPYLAKKGQQPDDSLCAELHTRWQCLGRRGVILGPHGTGKSTLVTTLAQAWSAEHGYQVTLLMLHNSQRTLLSEIWQQQLRESSLLIVDGYEQLGWHSRWRLQRWLHHKDCGLLVTTHRACRLPTLYHVEPCYETLLAVVRHLLASQLEPALAEKFVARYVAEAWQATGANARETLFRLYDCWEQELGNMPRAAESNAHADASDSAAPLTLSK